MVFTAPPEESRRLQALLVKIVLVPILEWSSQAEAAGTLVGRLSQVQQGVAVFHPVASAAFSQFIFFASKNDLRMLHEPRHAEFIFHFASGRRLDSQTGSE